MDKITSKSIFLKEQRNKVINYKEFLAAAKNYKLSNKKDSLNNFITRLLQNIRAYDPNNIKITNKDLDIIKYLNTIFIKDSKKINEFNNADYSLYNKQIITRLLKVIIGTQKLGVVAETDGNNISYHLDLVERSAWAIMSDFYAQLLSVKLVQQKPEKNKKKK